MVDFKFVPQEPLPPTGEVQLKIMHVMSSTNLGTVWQSKDLAIAAGVRRGSARGALQELIRKMHVTYARDSTSEITGFRLVTPEDWK